MGGLGGGSDGGKRGGETGGGEGGGGEGAITCVKTGIAGEVSTTETPRLEAMDAPNASELTAAMIAVVLILLLCTSSKLTKLVLTL